MTISFLKPMGPPLMTIKNLTPHEITLYLDGDQVLAIPPTLPPARCVEQIEQQGAIVTTDGTIVPVTRVILGSVINLPNPEDGTVYVVSRPVAEALPFRSDLLIPGEAVRDADGRIIGCRSLSVVG